MECKSDNLLMWGRIIRYITILIFLFLYTIVILTIVLYEYFDKDNLNLTLLNQILIPIAFLVKIRLPQTRRIPIEGEQQEIIDNGNQ